VAAELRFGAEKQGSPELAGRVDRALASLLVMALSSDADRLYGQLRGDLERRGPLIGANDMLIAAHALAIDAVVVTDNTDEFSRVQGLQIESWLVRSPAPKATARRAAAGHVTAVSKTAGQFINTTPASGTCREQPQYWAPGYFSLLFPWAGNPRPGPMGTKTVVGPSNDPRNGFYFGFDASEHQITATNQQGKSHTLQLSIDAIGWGVSPVAKGMAKDKPLSGTNLWFPLGSNCESVSAPWSGSREIVALTRIEDRARRVDHHPVPAAVRPACTVASMSPPCAPMPGIRSGISPTICRTVSIRTRQQNRMAPSQNRITA
jgi:tRNA(fMet)-specific endonuclease VapC